MRANTRILRREVRRNETLRMVEELVLLEVSSAIDLTVETVTLVIAFVHMVRLVYLDTAHSSAISFYL